MLRQTDSSTCQTVWLHPHGTVNTNTWLCTVAILCLVGEHNMCSCLYLHIHGGLKSDSRFWHNMTHSSQWVPLQGCCWLLSPSSIKPLPSHSSCEHGNVEVMMRVVILIDSPIMFMVGSLSQTSEHWAESRAALLLYACTPVSTSFFIQTVWLSQCNI